MFDSTERKNNADWDKLGKVFDSMSMILYGLFYFGVMIWLIASMFKYNDQFEQFHDEILENAKEYDCELRKFNKDRLTEDQIKLWEMCEKMI